jgi:hypothetical protein
MMKTSLFLVLTLIAMNARAEMPMSGTSAGSPQTAGPLNSPPNGAGGTYGYPNNAIDPNTVNPGLPQQPYFVGPYYDFGGSVSGTTTSPNPMGVPFVTPPATATPGELTPAVPSTVPAIVPSGVPER